MAEREEDTTTGKIQPSEPWPDPQRICGRSSPRVWQEAKRNEEDTCLAFQNWTEGEPRGACLSSWRR